MEEKITVEAVYAIDWEQRYAHLSLRVSPSDDRMRVNLDRLAQRTMIEQHRQREQTHEHYRLEGNTTRYVSDIVVETGDVLLLTVWKGGSLHGHAVWEVAIGKSGDEEQLLYPGDVTGIELQQQPEEEL